MARAKKAVELAFPPRGWHRSPWQEDVYTKTRKLSRLRVVWFVAGRGAGKDICAMQCVMRDALKWYGRQKLRQARGSHIRLNPLVKIWVVAPQENNLKQTWDDWRGMLKDLAAEWAPAAGFESTDSDWLFREVVRENKFIVFGRGEIEIEKRLSSTRNAMRGPGVDLVHWTEAAMETVPGEFERAFIEELTGTINRPGRLGRVYFTTSPQDPMGGHFDELKKRFGEGTFQHVENGTLVDESGLNLYVHVDSFQNDLWTPEQLEMLRAEEKNGWRYERERKARYVVGDKGGEIVFGRESVVGCLVASRGARPGYRRIVFGVDIARFGKDEICYCGVDQDSGEIVHLEFRKKQGGKKTVADMVRLRLRYPGCRFRVDSTGHQGYISDYAPLDLKVEETQFSRAKERWVEGLGMLMDNLKLRIPDPDICEGLSDEEREAFRKLIKQLLQFVKVQKGSGGAELRHPDGEFDDGVDGLILATMDMATELQGKMDADRALGAVTKAIFG